MVRLLLSPSPTELEIDKTRHIVRPRQVFMFGAKETMGGISRSYKGERYDCLGLFIKPEQIEDGILAERVNEIIDAGSPKSLSMNASIASLTSDLVGQKAPGLDRDLITESWALRALAHCLNSPANDSRPRVSVSHRQALMRTREFMLHHLEQPLSLQRLSEEAGMGLTAFKTKYRALFDETPFETLRAMRLDAAQADLKADRLSVSEACYRAGYAHIGSFSDAYFRRFGCRPSMG